MPRSFVGALGAVLLLPSLLLAQEKTVTGRVWIQEGTQSVHLTVNRSETYQLVFPVGNPWERLMRVSADQVVEAKLRVVSPGMFGGSAMVTGLAKDVKGRVIAAMDGGPVNISVSKSEGYQIEGAFRGYLLRHADQEVEARVRITQPGMFGAKATLDCVYLNAQGHVFAAMDGGPVHISVNKSNVFQVVNEPFTGLVLANEGQRVSARLRLIEPGMFGGKAEVIHLDGRTTRNRLLRVQRGGRLFSAGFVPAGTHLEVTGVSQRYPRYLEVRLADGRSGLIARGSLTMAQPVPLHGIAAVVETE